MWCISVCRNSFLHVNPRQVVTHLLRNGRQVIEEEIHLVREVLHCMGEERLKLVLEKELQEHGLHSRYPHCVLRTKL